MSAGGSSALDKVCYDCGTATEWRTHTTHTQRTRMKDMPEMEGIGPDKLVVAMMTATAMLEGDCDCEYDEHCDAGHVAPVMEIALMTSDGQEQSFYVHSILVAPLLESIMKLMQVYVGVPQGGDVDVPDSPDDIDWNTP